MIPKWREYPRIRKITILEALTHDDVNLVGKTSKWNALIVLNVVDFTTLLATSGPETEGGYPRGTGSSFRKQENVPPLQWLPERGN